MGANSTAEAEFSSPGGLLNASLLSCFFLVLRWFDRQAGCVCANHKMWRVLDLPVDRMPPWRGRFAASEDIFHANVYLFVCRIDPERADVEPRLIY